VVHDAGAAAVWGWQEVFHCRCSLGTATLHDLQERRKDLLLASSGFREASSTGLATYFMSRQFLTEY